MDGWTDRRTDGRTDGSISLFQLQSHLRVALMNAFALVLGCRFNNKIACESVCGDRKFDELCSGITLLAGALFLGFTIKWVRDVFLSSVFLFLSIFYT